MAKLTERQRCFMLAAKGMIRDAEAYDDWSLYSTRGIYDEEDRAMVLDYYKAHPEEAKADEAAFEAIKKEHVVDASGIYVSTLKGLEKKGFIQIVSLPEDEWKGGKLNPTLVKIIHF